jgi:NAD(P)-dependent dehydrogenase (short-subunit alcohol dehydrogenase family)
MPIRDRSEAEHPLDQRHQENVSQFATNFFGGTRTALPTSLKTILTVLTVINLTTAFLPYFRKQRDGTIVNISSMVSSAARETARRASPNTMAITGRCPQQ